MRDSLAKLVDSSWFSLVDLSFVLGSGVLWFRYPKYGWFILAAALLPKMLCLLAGKAPFRSTVFDLPMVVFLFTALIGTIFAYDSQGSWAKFWLVLGSVFLFYSLASQKRENAWMLVKAAALLGVAATIFFLLVYDWQANPVRSELVNRIGEAWMKVRPTIQYTMTDEDFITDVLLVLFPFPLALFFSTRLEPKKNRVWLVFSIISVLIFMIGLSMASIMMALTVLVVGGSIFIWRQIYRLAERYSDKRVLIFYWIITGLSILALLILLIGFPDQLLVLIKRISIFSRFEDRIAVNVNTIHLVKDFIFTGGGLGAFPGLYSRYILSIPYFFIPICSSLFLQIALEQGVVGSIAYASVLIGGALLLFESVLRKRIKPDQFPHVYMLVMGYCVLIVVGLIDAMLFTGIGIYLIFVIPGFCTFVIDEPPGKDSARHIPNLLLGAGLVIFLVSVGGKFFSIFYANLGAIEMARVELGGWRWEERMDSNPLEDYQAATQFFQMAMKLDNGNSTANYRLGMMAAGKQDFSEGCRYLETAIESQPYHRGISKNLGYCYLWLGKINEALPYLKMIPEARDELKVYVWWWESQNRKDLSGFADQMVLELSSQ
jgi:hypothetical protein